MHPAPLGSGAILSCVLAAFGSAQSAPAFLDVRFCGQESMHPYPLSTAKGIQGPARYSAM